MNRVLVTTLLVAATSGVASAHKPSDAHLQIAISGDQLTGTLAVALRDLDGALDLDADGNGDITWGEALAAGQRIDAYARQRLAIADGDEVCKFTFGAGRLVDFSDGAYWAMPLTGACPSAPATLAITYALLFDIDAQHRGIVQIQTARGTQTTVVRDRKPILIELAASSPAAYAQHGFARVWSSPTQLVFLACLVLPVVLLRRGRRWDAASSPREVARGTARTFAAFAIASTATLLLSAADLVYLPPELVELAIALSIVVVATINLLRVADARWDFAFELGLLQGLGGALWLRDAGLATHHLAPVLGFAAGVVAGQAALVGSLVPALFLIRRTFAYRTLLWGGSAATAIAAVVWTCERWIA